MPAELRDQDLWFHGPNWLINDYTELFGQTIDEP